MSGVQHPMAVKRKAAKMYGMGHSAVAIARELGAHADSVRRWAEQLGVTKGALVMKPVSDADMFPDVDAFNERVDLPMNAAELLIEKDAARAEVVAMTRAAASPTERYQQLVASHGLSMLERAFAAPPICKNMRDLKTLTEIMNGALGITGGKSGSGRLSIDLSILTKSGPSPVVDAEIVGESK